ncbi:uncharacterized protein PHALS_09655 [Plasmopara halstedii]|uniref:Uncharacterized protein n=1 Tax=Plasmopara halstedii TaxID=4781 RepID=A0A0P1AF14_PLAHL|nr:uncharacterized protein PHALS_09655 [Plasmopara halstedii]CEG39406.1 hypothetical protein PHALS_09655 [Plasmopara halstedii]|eukprot:XP_024575775.1 hypothetical protein PHALS_09655 [Plasmopara halstedii]
MLEHKVLIFFLPCRLHTLTHILLHDISALQSIKTAKDLWLTSQRLRTLSLNQQ